MSYITGNKQNIEIIEGLSSDRSLLSCTSDGTKVNLWNTDDGSGRQQWSISLVDGTSNLYHITVLRGVDGNRKFLSCTSDGTKVELWNTDDGSGRQRWSIMPVTSETSRVFNIKVAGGVNTDKVYLSCTPDGILVDLRSLDDGSGRQRWRIRPQFSPAEKRIMVTALTNMLQLLGVIFLEGGSSTTNVTSTEAEKMIKNAVTEYRETPNVEKLSLDAVHDAIDRGYNKVRSDVTSFFNEEIAEASLMAVSQASMAAGSIFSFFPLVSVILDATALATMATAAGLEIDIEARGSKIVAEANGLKAEIDKEPELAPAKKWNDARATVILTMGQLNAGMQDYRGDSSLYALIFVIDQQNQNNNPQAPLTDDELFQKLKQLCIDVKNLGDKFPNLGDTLADVVADENPAKIKEAIQAMSVVAPGIAQLIGAVVGTFALGAKLAYNVYKNYDSIKTSWNAVEGDEIPEGMEGRWTKTMGTVEKVQAGTFAIVGIVGFGIEVWQAVKTEKDKEKALKAIADNRDAVKDFYDSLLSHVH